MKTLITILSCLLSLFSFSQFSNIILSDSVKLDSSNFRVFYYDNLSVSDVQNVKSYLDSSEYIVKEKFIVDTTYIERTIFEFNLQRRVLTNEKMGPTYSLMNTQKRSIEDYSFQAIPIQTKMGIKFLIIVVVKENFENWTKKIIIVNDGGYAQQCYGIL